MSVGGFLLVSLVILIMGVLTWRRKTGARHKSPANKLEDKPELSSSTTHNGPQQSHLIDGQEYLGPELAATSIRELYCDGIQHEMLASHDIPELSSNTLALEMPATNVQVIP